MAIISSDNGKIFSPGTDNNGASNNIALGITNQKLEVKLTDTSNVHLTGTESFLLRTHEDSTANVNIVSGSVTLSSTTIANIESTKINTGNIDTKLSGILKTHEDSQSNTLLIGQPATDIGSIDNKLGGILKTHEDSTANVNIVSGSVTLSSTTIANIESIKVATQASQTAIESIDTKINNVGSFKPSNYTAIYEANTIAAAEAITAAATKISITHLGLTEKQPSKITEYISIGFGTSEANAKTNAAAIGEIVLPGQSRYLGKPALATHVGWIANEGANVEFNIIHGV